jgi:hypothetical protein
MGIGIATGASDRVTYIPRIIYYKRKEIRTHIKTLEELEWPIGGGSRLKLRTGFQSVNLNPQYNRYYLNFWSVVLVKYP